MAQLREEERKSTPRAWATHAESRVTEAVRWIDDLEATLFVITFIRSEESVALAT